jgi:sterol desaturase/sphingolipid hydroxylase (fatty acid hydroxylase superfamily)
MDYFLDNALRLLHQPVRGGSPFYWLYCLTSLCVAALVYGSRPSIEGRRSMRRFFAFCFPKRIYLHPSSIVDYKLLLANALLAPANLVLSSLPVAVVSAQVASTLTDVFGPLRHHAEFAGWVVLGYTLISMLVREFAMYVDHVLVHKVPVLWQFHSVHHSAEVLTPITNERKHPVDIILVIGMVVVPLGACEGLAVYLLFGQVTVAKLFGVEFFVALFYLAGAHLRHSHVWLTYGRVLGRVLMSPAQHQIHHSRAPRHVDSNFGEMLAIFDWLFGTLYLPRGREQLSFGLPGGPAREHDGLVRAYVAPFVGAWRLLVGRQSVLSAEPTD